MRLIDADRHTEKDADTGRHSALAAGAACAVKNAG